MAYITKYGIVYHSSVCRDNWSNIIVVKTYRKPNGNVIDRKEPWKLQRSAVRSLKAVEEKLAEQIVVTGTWRSCSYQWELYRSDSSRYAHPNTTLHTQGLAIDVNMNWLNGLSFKDKALFYQLMKGHGWHQARPEDEPWHWSYKLTA